MLQIDKPAVSQADPNVTATTPTAALMTDLWSYKVPGGTELKVQPHDEISAYLKDAGAEAWKDR